VVDVGAVAPPRRLEVFQAEVEDVGVDDLWMRGPCSEAKDLQPPLPDVSLVVLPAAARYA